MLDRSFLRWPFFEERHRALAEQLETWAAQHCTHVDHHDADAACRKLVRDLGRDGWLKHTAPGEAPSDADTFKDEKGKFDKYFSDKPAAR